MSSVEANKTCWNTPRFFRWIRHKDIYRNLPRTWRTIVRNFAISAWRSCCWSSCRCNGSKSIGEGHAALHSTAQWMWGLSDDVVLGKKRKVRFPSRLENSLAKVHEGFFSACGFRHSCFPLHMFDLDIIWRLQTFGHTTVGRCWSWSLRMGSAAVMPHPILSLLSKKIATHPQSTPQAILRQLWKESLYSLLVKVKGCVLKVCWNNLRC